MVFSWFWQADVVEVGVKVVVIIVVIAIDDDNEDNHHGKVLMVV